MASTRRIRVPAIGRRSTAERSRPSELSVPTHFRCPISLELMTDPVTLPTGITYDRQSIETWLAANSTCPVTNQPLAGGDHVANQDLAGDGHDLDLLIPNHAIRRMIQDWCVAHRSLGVDRIPTPKCPLTSSQAADILSDVAAASASRNVARCHAAVAQIKALAKESERNRRCIASTGAARVLAAGFGAFSTVPATCSTVGLTEEILSALAGMLPLDEEARWRIASPDSLSSIVSVLSCGDLAGRVSAVLVIRDLVSALNADLIDSVTATEGLIEALVKLVREPISPLATKASLVAAFYMVSASERTAKQAVDLGLVSLLLELLVGADKSVSEKALAVLDGLCDCEMGREVALGHALAVPVLVKKMFRVSEMATEFAVSALWKLCRNGRECLVEALQVGAFQKLLLLLQVGCGEATRMKASDMLKLLNCSRGQVECIESMDFKGLKRPF